MMRKLLGVDPGASGGFAAMMEDGSCVQVWKQPDTERDICNLLDGIRPDLAFLEAVHSMPQQGVSAVFSFGRNYGFLRGLLIGLKIPFVEVTPQSWQKAMGVPRRGDKTKTEHKNVLKALAQQLWPELHITHHTADSVLICEFGRRKDK